MKQKLLLISLFAFTGLSAQIPTLEWANAMGGTTGDISREVIFDASGNVYTVGEFTGTADLDPSAGSDMHTSAGSSDIFITKFNSSGAFVWARSIGGTGVDNGIAIDVDASGNVYFAGSYENTVDFDPESGSYPLTSNGAYEIFVCKLTSAGALDWAKSMGSFGDEAAYDIYLSPSNEVYTLGYFSLTVDFDPGTSTDNFTSAGGYDVFIHKMDAAGTYISTTQYGGTNYDYGNAFTFDAAGNMFIAGYFSGTVDFDPGTGSSPLTSIGSNDAYVSKFYASGTFAWVKGWGTTTAEYAYDIAVDLSGNVYTTGRFDGTVDFDPGAGTASMTSAGSRDVFISKLDSTGTFVWAKQIGSTAIEVGYVVETDSDGNLYVSGTFGSTPIDADPGTGTTTLTGAGTESFLIKLDDTGAFTWAIQFSDMVRGMALDASDNIYACGNFTATQDFDPGAGTFNMTATAGGLNDAFTLKLSQGISTGIDGAVLSARAIVYPNPSNGYFSMRYDSGISLIRIMNVLGEELHVFTADQNGGTVSIDLSSQASGMYFYQLESEGKITGTGKILIK